MRAMRESRVERQHIGRGDHRECGVQYPHLAHTGLHRMFRRVAAPIIATVISPRRVLTTADRVMAFRATGYR